MNADKILAARPEFSPLSIVRALWKGKWYACLVWVAATVAAYYVIARMPAIYLADVLVGVDSPKISERYVASMVNNGFADRLAAINRDILSTTRLKALIADLRLFGARPGTEVAPETVDLFRSNLGVRIERGWLGDKPAAFRISYVAPDPNVAARVANQLAGLYIAESDRVREDQVSGTSDFIQTQLDRAKRRLDQLESAVSQYKAQHIGELPQQEQGLLAGLDRLQMEIQANKDSIDRARENKRRLEISLEAADDTAAVIARSNAAGVRSPVVSLPAPVGAPDPVSPAQRQLETLEGRLQQLLIRYSDDHPDVKRLKFEIERLNEQLARRQALTAASPAPPANSSEPAPPHTPPPPAESVELARARERITVLKTELATAGKELNARMADRDRLQQQAAVLRQKIDQLPIREQELAHITRDYETSKMDYQNLLGKKLAAQMATDLETRQETERFAIIDAARVPRKPIKPNRRLLLAAGSLAGLALGFVLVFVKELRRDVLLGEWELPPHSVVLGRLPKIMVQQGGRV